MSKTKYLYKLARFLLFKYSFTQIIDILNDYNDFLEVDMRENNLNMENPKAVSKNLKGELKNYIINLLLISCLVINLTILILVQNAVSINIYFNYTIFLLSSIFCPILIYFIIGGKKLIILDALNEYSIEIKKITYFHLAYMLIATIVTFLLFNINVFPNKILSSGKLNLILNILIFDILFNVIYIIYKVLINGSYYFTLIPHSFGLLFMILAIKASTMQLTSKVVFIYLISFSLLFYLTGIFISYKFFNLIKNEKQEFSKWMLK